MSQQETTIIRSHNDRFRTGDQMIPGTVVMTQGLVAHLQATDIEQRDVVRIVQEYDDFTADNDPYGQHDFGVFELSGERCFWKLDLYDNDKQYFTPDPTNPTVTHRVLTIMLASDY
ncbi:hypothetical protein JANAI62_03440 [Jannaschia pagri]|uniref:DUF3768 domain-containing protein n=1 Tax=Jannaschia pagri TaxID=2829797 RepID=A0ABQ4NHG6_9RHOB|nr:MULTISPECIES: DUF3768 domain-containing protein [unclassified Jannaschia]GIT90173.1 hypothetical protein JANAI61_06310 [Jannaschia sp. AI_61]GIT93721.1 hypothetical protein JANAI62_03440 [Jannaschia sp. AI_62]